MKFASKNKFFLALLLCIVFPVSHLFSSQLHKINDFEISFKIPISVPIFTASKNEGVYTFWQTGYKNVATGIEVDVGVFISDSVSLGGAMGYNFAYDRGDKLFSKVPLLFRFNYFPLSLENIEVPISLGLGVNYFKYRSMEHIVPEFMLESGFNIFWSYNWAFAFRVGANLYAELYKDASKINISGMLPITIGVTYRK